MRTKERIYLVTLLLIYSCFNSDLKKNKTASDKEDSTSPKINGMYSFDFVGKDSLHSFLNSAELNDIKYLYVFDDSVVIEGNWDFKNLEILSLVSKSYIKLEGLSLPDSLRFLRLSFNDFLDKGVLKNTSIDHLVLRIESFEAPSFLNRIGNVERLSLSGKIADKSILYMFKNIRFIDLNNSPIEDSLTDVDSLILNLQD